jgi:hypothetical protein
MDVDNIVCCAMWHHHCHQCPSHQISSYDFLMFIVYCITKSMNLDILFIIFSCGTNGVIGVDHTMSLVLVYFILKDVLGRTPKFVGKPKPAFKKKEIQSPRNCKGVFDLKYKTTLIYMSPSSWYHLLQVDLNAFLTSLYLNLSTLCFVKSLWKVKEMESLSKTGSHQRMKVP